MTLSLLCTDVCESVCVCVAAHPVPPPVATPLSADTTEAPQRGPVPPPHVSTSAAAAVTDAHAQVPLAGARGLWLTARLLTRSHPRSRRPRQCARNPRCAAGVLYGLTAARRVCVHVLSVYGACVQVGAPAITPSAGVPPPHTPSAAPPLRQPSAGVCACPLCRSVPPVNHYVCSLTFGGVNDEPHMVGGGSWVGVACSLPNRDCTHGASTNHAPSIHCASTNHSPSAPLLMPLSCGPQAPGRHRLSGPASPQRLTLPGRRPWGLAVPPRQTLSRCRHPRGLAVQPRPTPYWMSYWRSRGPKGRARARRQAPPRVRPRGVLCAFALWARVCGCNAECMRGHV
jgi:hypothetical protein